MYDGGRRFTSWGNRQQYGVDGDVINSEIDDTVNALDGIWDGVTFGGALDDLGEIGTGRRLMNGCVRRQLMRRMEAARDGWVLGWRRVVVDAPEVILG